MKYNKKTFKKIETQCNVCRNNFLAWLPSIGSKEEDVKKQMNNYCPACRITGRGYKTKW